MTHMKWFPVERADAMFLLSHCAGQKFVPITQ